jgi:transposase
MVVTRRPKYAYRTCTEGVVQAPEPARLISGGLPTEATVDIFWSANTPDQLSLFRQAQIYSRHSVELDRSTLAVWVGALIEPLRHVDGPTPAKRHC